MHLKPGRRGQYVADADAGPTTASEWFWLLGTFAAALLPAMAASLLMGVGTACAFLVAGVAVQGFGPVVWRRWREVVTIAWLFTVATLGTSHALSLCFAMGLVMGRVLLLIYRQQQQQQQLNRVAEQRLAQIGPAFGSAALPLPGESKAA